MILYCLGQYFRRKATKTEGEVEDCYVYGSLVNVSNTKLKKRYGIVKSVTSDY